MAVFGAPDAGLERPVPPAVHLVAPFSAHCKSQRLYLFEGPINTCWLAWGSLSWHSSIFDILVSLSKHLPLISFIDYSSL